MSKKIAVGIDVGTYQVKVIVTELVKDKKRYVPKIIGKGLSKSKGLRHGYVTNRGDVSRSVALAVNQAEREAGVKIKKAYISINGIGLEGINIKNTTIITRADSEITQIDIENVLTENEDSPNLLNKKVICPIPLEYKIDDKKVLGNPIGMKGSKLKSEILYITCIKQHIQDLIHAVEEVGIEIEDIFPNPIAGSFVTLNKSQKIAGCVLANIGAETTSIIVFENNLPISLEVFPLGSTNITNNIALELKIDLENAEKIKQGILTSVTYSRTRLEKIFENQLEEIFKLIESHLKKINRNELLPAGIILSGGASGINSIKNLAQDFLNLPSSIANLNFVSNSNKISQDSTWAVAYGLCLMGLTSEKDGENSFLGIKGSFQQLKKWIAQFFV